jgi:hypothetical protein
MFALTACIVTSVGVKPLGKGEYYVTVRDKSSFYGNTTAAKETRKMAKEFCEKKSGDVREIKMSTSNATTGHFASARLTFRCDGEVSSYRADTIDTKQIDNEFDFKINKNKNLNSYALIIGINKYEENTNVIYADTSALTFKELASKTLGIPEENIILLLNHKATSGQIKAKLELLKELSDNKGNIYLYFAGHGVPAKDGNVYILPADMSADSIHLEPNLRLDNIYAKLSKSNAKNIFVFMDSCFSGKDDKGSLLYKGVAPVLKTKKVQINNDKLTVFTAGKSSDFANDFQDKKQRMFSYYLIKELSTGKKDLAKVYEDIKAKVKRSSLQKGIGYKQEPQIYGNKNVLLY